MKYINKLGLMIILIMSVIFFGCKEKLELAPFNQISSNTAYATPERCILSLNGVYDAAQSGVYDPLNGGATSVRGYPFGAAAISQQDMRGEDMINVATFFQITYQSTISPVSPNNVNMWKELYALINKTNLGIAGFRNAGATSVISSTLALQYEAECRFLRAMAHHELLLHFARPYADGGGSKLGVPYRDFPIESSAAVELAKTLPRETVAADYTKILLDLDFAEANLPALQNVSVPGESTYRATKAAAIALKMRIKLHKADYPAVITEGAKLLPPDPVINPLIPSSVISPIGGWALTPNVDGPFLNNASKESIFSIKNDPLDNPQTNAALARMYGQSSVATGGRGLVSISPIVWLLPEWTCNDRRRTALYYNGTDGAGATAKFTSKYTDAVNQSDWTPYIRYADVLLTQAEAEARNNSGVSQRAIDLLNTVRNRAIVDSVNNQYTTTTLATKNGLINAILKERRIEFLAEGKRWADIHRLALDPVFGTGGVPEKMANGFANIAVFTCGGTLPPTGTPAIPYSDYRFLWPIPLQERNTNPIIEQNPGY